MACSSIRAVLVLAWLLPVAAWAQGDTAAAAKLHRAEGARFFQRGSYAEAIEQFEKAHALDPVGEDFFNIGQAERMRGDCRAALRAYEAYLEGNPEPARQEVTRMNVARCEATLAASEPSPPVRPRSDPPPPTPLRPRSTAPPAVSLRPDAAPEVWYRDRVGGVLAGAGLVGLAGSATLWVLADARTGAANDAESLADHRRLADSASTLRTGSLVLVGVGGALLAGAAYRYVTRASRARASVSVGAIIEHGGGVVVVEVLQ